MKQLFVTDMDGTLLSPESRVDSESAAIISDLTRRGALITVATARTPATVEPLLSATLTGAPPIVLTGASMWNRSDKTFLNPSLMPEELAEQVTAICTANGLRPMTYTLGAPGMIEMYVYGIPSAKEQKFLDERSRLPYKHINLLPGAQMPPCHENTMLIFAIGDIAAIQAVGEEIGRCTPCSYSAYPDIFNRSIGYLEVFAPEVSKASAVLRLKELTGADELTVFGDNLNDIPMMRVADRAVAVENALDEVKAVAHEVIGPNSQPSVASYIQSHFRP